MVPPLLYIITDRRATGGRPLADVIAQALQGARPYRDSRGRLPVAVQLREKDLPGRALYELGLALRRITGDAGAALFVNDRVDVALAVEADGVHLPVAGFTSRQAARLAPTLARAISTHCLADLDGAGAEVAFAVFGPVFATPSKQGMGTPGGLPLLKQAATRGPPVVALGGVDATTAAACRDAGAVGVACIRAVMAAPRPDETVNALLAVTGAQPMANSRFIK